nr:hypothetical protein [Candidatus Gracilibacteria bacterium]
MTDAIEKFELKPNRDLQGLSEKVVNILKNSEQPEHEIDKIIQLWENEYLKAGFDLKNNQALENFDLQTVTFLETQLDKLIVEIENEMREKLNFNLYLINKIEKLDQNIDKSLLQVPYINLKFNSADKEIKLKCKNIQGFNQKNGSEKIDLRELKIASLLAIESKYNLKNTLNLDNTETNENEGIKITADYLEKTYFPANPHLLEKLDIKDYKKLNPQQAILLASYIPINSIKYSKKQQETSYSFNDEASIVSLLNWQNDESGNGVCRNYASVAVGILEALKLLQNPVDSQINNLYALYLQDKFENRLSPGNIKNHAWNSFFQLNKISNSQYEMEFCVTDPTWADIESQYLDTARQGRTETKLDFSQERMFTFIDRLETNKLLTGPQYLEQLWENYLKMPSLELKNINYHEPEIQLFAPSRLMIGQKMAISFLNSNLKNPAEKELALKFWKTAIIDLQDYFITTHQLKNIVPIEMIEKMQNPYLLNLNLLAQLKSKLINSENANAMHFETELLGNLAHNLSDNTIKKLTTEDLGIVNEFKDKKRIQEFFQANYNFFLKQYPAEKFKIYHQLSPLAQKVYKEFAPQENFDFFNEEHKNLFELERAYQCKIDVIDDIKIDKILIDLKKVLAQVGSDYPEIAQANIRISNDKDEEFHRINLHPKLKAEEIEKRISNFVNRQRKWQEIKNLCAAELKIDSLFFDKSSDIDLFLKNCLAYFQQVPTNLIRFKSIEIKNSANQANLLQPVLNSNDFLQKNYKNIDKTLNTNNPKKIKSDIENIDHIKFMDELRKDVQFISGTIVDASIDEKYLKEFYQELKLFAAENYPQKNNYADIVFEISKNLKSNPQRMLKKIYIDGNKSVKENFKGLKKEIDERVKIENKIHDIQSQRFPVKIDIIMTEINDSSLQKFDTLYQMLKHNDLDTSSMGSKTLRFEISNNEVNISASAANEKIGELSLKMNNFETNFKTLNNFLLESAAMQDLKAYKLKSQSGKTPV